jgi:hypothetical protein
MQCDSAPKEVPEPPKGSLYRLPEIIFSSCTYNWWQVGLGYHKPTRRQRSTHFAVSAAICCALFWQLVWRRWAVSRDGQAAGIYIVCNEQPANPGRPGHHPGSPTARRPAWARTHNNSTPGHQTDASSRLRFCSKGRTTASMKYAMPFYIPPTTQSIDT